jgi:UDP-2,3-diacylglucosamine pyrophosphatase LpxH
MRYFISDLHIGDGSPWDRFGKKKAKFLVKLLERIDRNTNHSGELILLGDIFDFTLLTAPETSPLKVDSAALFARVKKAYPDLFKALREFVRSGNGLFYVWGNHDYLMRFQCHTRQFARAIMSRLWDSFRQDAFGFSDYYISASHRLYAEHGHRYDIRNVHLDGRHATLGTLLTSRFIKKWETWKSPSTGGKDLEASPYPFRLLGDIRPTTNILYYIDRLVKRGVVPEKTRQELANDLYRIDEEWNASLPHIFIRILETMPWFIQEGIVGSKLREDDHTPKDLRKRARLLLEGYSTEIPPTQKKVTVGMIKDLNFVPRLVIFGHTHFLEYNAYKKKHLYVNTGSWRSTAFVDQEGRIVSVEDLCPYTEVYPVEDGGLPRVLCRRAADGRRIDIPALLKQHEKFGLKATLGYR